MILNEPKIDIGLLSGIKLKNEKRKDLEGKKLDNE